MKQIKGFNISIQKENVIKADIMYTVNDSENTELMDYGDTSINISGTMTVKDLFARTESAIKSKENIPIDNADLMLKASNNFIP